MEATWVLAASVELSALQWRAMELAADRAVEHAQRAGHLVLMEEAKAHRAPARLYGPIPVGEALAWFDAHAPRHPQSPAMRGQLEAMRGNLDGARRLVAKSRERATEL